MSVAIREQSLRSQAVCERAEITYKQLDHWTRTGLLEPIGHPLPGSGAPREYRLREVAVARFLDVVVAWTANGSHLTRERVRGICEFIRLGGRGPVQLVRGVTVDLDVICGEA